MDYIYTVVIPYILAHRLAFTITVLTVLTICLMFYEAWRMERRADAEFFEYKE